MKCDRGGGGGGDGGVSGTKDGGCRGGGFAGSGNGSDGNKKLININISSQVQAPPGAPHPRPPLTHNLFNINATQEFTHSRGKRG